MLWQVSDSRRGSHWVDGQYRTSDDAADRPLNVRYDQKLAKYHRLADQSGFHFVPTVFSYTGQIHESIKRLITEQLSRFVNTNTLGGWGKAVLSEVYYEIVDKACLYGDC